MEAYSLNPQILPGQPLKEHEHHKMVVIFIVIVALSAAAGIWYWWNMTQEAENSAMNQSSSQDDLLRTRVAALLKQAPIQASQTEIDHVTALLSHKKMGSSADTQSVGSHLPNN